MKFTASIFLCLFQAAHLVLALPTTTTTTTTESPQAQIVDSEPVIEVYQDPCTRCERYLEPYFNAMRSHDMITMANALDAVCETAVPKVEKCKVDTQIARCQHEYASPWLPTFNFFCQRKAAIQDSSSCWSSGYTQGVQMCLNSYMADGPTLGACVAMRNMITCVQNMMGAIPQCSTSAISFVTDYLKFAGQYSCPDGSYL